MSLDYLLKEHAHSPDVLDCLASLSADEVFTPPALVNSVLDCLPEDVWTNPDLRWLDPACKSGVFLREAARRLMIGLESTIPDPGARRHHILKKMLFGLAITELTGLISRRSLYYSKNATNDISVLRFENQDGHIIYSPESHTFADGQCSLCGAPESLESKDREEQESYAYSFIHGYDGFGSDDKDMRFDVIIGNPPYQLSDGGYGASATPIYHLFVEKALSLNPRYVSFIIPARWYAGGKNLDKFRKKMIEDRSLRKLVDYPNAGDAFPGVEVKGGVCYFLWDRDYDGDCEVVTMVDGKSVSSAVRDLRKGGNVIIRSNEAVSILEKVQAKQEDTLDQEVSNTKPFGLRTFFKDYGKKRTKQKTVKLYVRGGVGWVASKEILKNKDWISKYKTITTRAYGAGEGYPHQVINVPLVTEPDSACTETYLVAGLFDTKKEAENRAIYLSTKFVRFLVSLRKNTQDIKASSFLFVPNLDMTKKWTDKALYKRYKLSDEEIQYIETHIKPMIIEGDADETDA